MKNRETTNRVSGGTVECCTVVFWYWSSLQIYGWRGILKVGEDCGNMVTFKLIGDSDTGDKDTGDTGNTRDTGLDLLKSPSP